MSIRVIFATACVLSSPTKSSKPMLYGDAVTGPVRDYLRMASPGLFYSKFVNHGFIDTLVPLIYNLFVTSETTCPSFVIRRLFRFGGSG